MNEHLKNAYCELYDSISSKLDKLLKVQEPVQSHKSGMIDKEKVIKALELEVKYPYTWECASECPYYGKTDHDCYTQVVLDVLELLKEQEQIIDTYHKADSFLDAHGWKWY